MKKHWDTAGQIVLVSVLLIALGCSAEKNTLVSRTYHNVTARFNVYFNGNESFENGISKIERNFEDDYSRVLPIFYYGDENAAAIAAMDMDRTIEKCSKLISLHSITAKPEIKNNRELSLKEREFYNQKEYNEYVDDAYLLMGKAYFYKLNYDMAATIFRQVQNDFRGQPEAYESQVWMARIYNETGQFKSSAEIFGVLENNADFPDRQLDLLYTTIADNYLKQNNYPQAVSYLEKSLAVERKKNYRTRYLFILAQLYEKTGDMQKSSEYYARVIRMNPPFEMTFNATINKALNYQEGFGKAEDIEKELRRMLRDDKYNDYQDQVYYALGDFHTKEGDSEAALEQYKQSIRANINNPGQKIRSFLTIADYYYSMPDYVNAQAYYDSVITLINTDYPDFDMLVRKSGSLSVLVEYVQTVEREDSLQLLARLDRQDLYDRIDAIIAGEREKRQQEQQRQTEEQLDRQFANQVAVQSSRSGIGSDESVQWYFYNETAKSLGFSEFRLNWGNRRLEDHWQRATRTSFAFEAENGMADAGTETSDTVPEQTFNRMSRDYYLATIPFTDSAMDASHNRIENALYNMGLLYKNDLKDYNRATDAFKDLIQRYPDSDYVVSANYNLYTIAREQNNIALEQFYKNTIIGEFPETMYAKVLNNPNYIQELERNKEEIELYYQETYQFFVSGNDAEVISRSDYALKTFTDDPLLPQFAYLGVLAKGRRTDRKTFRDNLLALISEYPQTEVADDAQSVVVYLDRETPEFLIEEEKVMATKLYSVNFETEHLFAFIVDRKINTNQLIFNIINFNLDYFDNLNLRVDLVNLDQQQNLLLVKPFKDMNVAVEYLNTIRDHADILKDIPEIPMTPVVISAENYNTLLKDRSVSRYMQFYNENYL